MNLLQDYLILHDLSESNVLNRLQDHGIISDLCVRADDVDAERHVGLMTL